MNAQSLSALFWANVTHGDAGECWPWAGATNGSGYGCYQVSGVRLYAHRQAYIEVKGDIPAGMVVRHACDNPICCNPSHLDVGSMAENSQDAVRRGRFRGRRALAGEDHPGAKINEDIVRAMRDRFDPNRRGDTTRAAKSYGISHSQAHRILRRQSWRHL